MEFIAWKDKEYMEMKKKMMVYLCVVLIISVQVLGCGVKKGEVKETESEGKKETVNTEEPIKEDDKVKGEVQEEENDANQVPDDLKHTWWEGLTYDFATDVANGKLYALDNGGIGTKDEISIPEYADIKVMDRGWFSIGGIDVTCFHVEDDSKITIQKNEITGDMQTDAKNCLLYINDTNQIVDSGGNIIPNYQDFHMTERGGIADEYSMIEGYFVLSGMVLFQTPEAVEYSDENQEGNSNLGKPMDRSAISDIGLVSWSYGNDARKSLMSFLNGKTVNVTTARQMQNKAEAISKRSGLSAADIGLAQLISTIAGMLEGDATADSNRENYIQYYDALNSYMGTY